MHGGCPENCGTWRSFITYAHQRLWFGRYSPSDRTAVGYQRLDRSDAYDPITNRLILFWRGSPRAALFNDNECGTGALDANGIAELRWTDLSPLKFRPPCYCPELYRPWATTVNNRPLVFGGCLLARDIDYTTMCGESCSTPMAPAST